MSQNPVAVGAAANDGTGDALRTAFGKLNADIAALYASSSGLTVGTTAITGGTAYRLLYETGGHLVGEITNGASGTVLTSNGTGAAPGYQSVVNSLNGATGALSLNTISGYGITDAVAASRGSRSFSTIAELNAATPDFIGQEAWVSEIASGDGGFTRAVGTTAGAWQAIYSIGSASTYTSIGEGVINGVGASIQTWFISNATGEASFTALSCDTLNGEAPGFFTGAQLDYWGTAAPSGWIMADGRTIGDTGSGALNRANADTAALYALLWNSMANTEAPVSTGRGTSAALDFGAGKTIAVPDCRGRTVAGKDNMGGTDAGRLTGTDVTGAVLGSSGGEGTHQLTESELAAHTHPISAGQDAFGTGNITALSGNASASTVTNSAGIDTPHNNTQPTIIANKIIKL